MRTILLVDDEVAMRRKYRTFLREQGFTVIVAPNALSVANILMCESSRLDLIILDINIPEVDGRDIYDIIKEYAPNIPILVSSVIPLQDQKLKIPRAAGYFNKADSDEAFLAKVCKVLGVEKEMKDQQKSAKSG